MVFFSTFRLNDRKKIFILFIITLFLPTGYVTYRDCFSVDCRCSSSNVSVWPKEQYVIWLQNGLETSGKSYFLHKYRVRLYWRIINSAILKYYKNEYFRNNIDKPVIRNRVPDSKLKKMINKTSLYQFCYYTLSSGATKCRY